MNDLALTSKRVGAVRCGEEFQAEATVDSQELILCSCVCITYISYIRCIVYVYIFNDAQQLLSNNS